MKRIILYCKDIQMITGRTYRSSLSLLNDIRKHYHKADHHAITIDEFCEYMGIRPDSINHLLR